jgi:predicted O-linked N-acetylglucosamine transferase (SPINDLY family)
MQLMDIFLDTFGWSGGITTLNAITCDLPVVTCPGKLMRSRHSYGILKMLGVHDTITETEHRYVAIAAELGLNHDYRQAISQKIKANKHKVFEDKECIIALENFFRSVAHRN